MDTVFECENGFHAGLGKGTRAPCGAWQPEDQSGSFSSSSGEKESDSEGEGGDDGEDAADPEGAVASVAFGE